MNNILNCFKELCDNSTISDLQWDNDLQIIMFNDKRGKWKLIKDFQVNYNGRWLTQNE